MTYHNKKVDEFVVGTAIACEQTLPMLINFRERLMEAYGKFLPGSECNYPLHNALDEVIQYCQVVAPPMTISE